MKPFRKTASVLLAIALLFGAAGNLQAKEAESGAETPLMALVGELLGTRYKYAGSSPQEGFDCSGFARYVFAQLFGVELNRRSADQATQGSKIAKDKLREGDLVFFKTNGKSISHVGIYIGDGQFVHASTKRGIVITDMDDSYYAKRYVTARRILTEEQYLEGASRAEAERRLEERLAAAEAAKQEAGADGQASEETPEETSEETAGDAASGTGATAGEDAATGEPEAVAEEAGA